MLPVIQHPLFEIYVKSLDKKLKVRPFLVKEEKILLLAKEADDPESVRLAVIQILQNCIVDPIDVTKLPLFDVEMLFIKLRAKSVGESVKLVFTCKNEVDGVECGTNTQYKLDLDKVEYEIPEGHNPIVMISDTVGMKLKHTSLNTKLDIAQEPTAENALDVLFGSIDHIFNKDSVWKPENVPEDEMLSFIDNLTVEHMEAIKTFFTSAPKVVLNDVVTCSKCGFKHTLHTEGLLSFFI